MTIKNRMIYSSVILLFLFLVMVGSNWYGNRSVEKMNDLAYLFEAENMHLQGLFRGVNEFIIDEGEPLSREFTNYHLNKYDELHKLLMLTLKDNELKNVLENVIDPKWNIVKDGTTSFLKIKYINASNDEAMLQYGKLINEGKNLLKEVDTIAEKTQIDAKSFARKISTIINIIAVSIILLTCLVLYSLYRSITNPIKELNTIAEGFGEGDLSIFMDESKKDEFGKLASNFNQALNKLGIFIRKLREDINTVALNADKFSDDSSAIAANAQNQSIQTINAASATEELNATFNDIVNNSEQVSIAARESSELAFQSGDVVISAMNNLGIITNTVKEAAEIVNGLSQRSSQIGEIIKVIDEIADQTNLLALNANIEAARAGEHGRGFAVVANEVRKLAERTTEATKKITDMINGIQTDTNKAVMSMDTCTREVEAGNELAQKAGSSLQQILASSQNVTDMIQRIATAVDEQSSVTNNISSNLSAVAEIAEHTNKNAQKSVQSSRQLYSVAIELQNLANEFKLRDDIQDYAGLNSFPDSIVAFPKLHDIYADKALH